MENEIIEEIQTIEETPMENVENLQESENYTQNVLVENTTIEPVAETIVEEPQAVPAADYYSTYYERVLTSLNSIETNLNTVEINQNTLINNQEMTIEKLGETNATLSTITFVIVMAFVYTFITKIFRI